MMISKRYRKALLLAKTYPSADCYSDHVPVVGKFKLKLKKNSKPFTNIKFDLAILKTNQTIREKYQISVQNKFETLGDAEEVEQQWENFKSAKMEAATEIHGQEKSSDLNNVTIGKTNLVTKEVVIKLEAVHQYNQFMGAVDRSDQMVTNNAFKRCTLKWWKKAFFHMFMLGMLNAYIVHKATVTRKRRHKFLDGT
ncbi:PiggyBac transposable element-derived protein 4-like [Plakobranchus ocellatus]|uniref:PiggyBac transposable element-derived protein 4-like n=1 Tax=Plakobranchus ocellatus TaxID=259542 RepID=A0AAV4DYY4_9GAST|nr:PiggyBac transposable element-derived protein 4-like [Plakobranchus ocellatus]